ncbi:MAG TPA: zinc dependent phospholipase C family protein [Rectinemataceae bacterium]|nr:zinc dependent phospholipase C family protein [Rectinemataceae bacterium]
MAGQITHILAGEKALEASSREVCDSVLRERGRWFRLGCQGPDIFYHNQRTKPSALQYGALAHRHGYGTLLEAAVRALPRERRLPATVAGAYLLGLATHAAVDRRTHPFIVFYSGWADPAKPGSERYRSCHPFLERLLDESLLSQWRGMEPAQFDMESLVCGPEPRQDSDRELVALWAAGLRAAFPRATGQDSLLESRIANALEDARHFMRLTNPKRTAMLPGNEDWFSHLDDGIGPRSVSLVYPDRIPEGLELASLGSEGWEHPAGDGRRESSTYAQVVEEAAVDARAALDSLIPLLGEEDGEIVLARIVGDGGLSIGDLEGRPLPPRLSRPLPLAEIMTGEYERRSEWARRRAASH